MVAQETDITDHTAREAHYHEYRTAYKKEERKKSAWYRLFFPLAADYNMKENPYARYNHEDIYDPKTGYYSTTTNRFRDHYQD